MNFSLDPSSGYADTYLDVEFSITVPKHPKTILRIFNETSGDQLQILGTSFGYILDGDSLILKGQNSTSGHINIFNNDKMNKKFTAHRSVTLKCTADFFDEEGEKVGEDHDAVIFYNEMHSLDAGIIPFDLIVHNSRVDVDKNEPLSIDVISDLPKKYELSISTLDDRIRCNIEVSAKRGKTSIQIPAEFLFYDLELKSNRNKKFKISYVKHQGTTVSRIANKRYMPIPNSQIEFKSSGSITPNPQSRRGPIGELSRSQFVISDRYLVMCPQQYSGFSKKGAYSETKLMDLTMMVHEGQHMRIKDKQVKKFSDDSSAKITQTERSLQLAKQARPKMRKPQIAASQVHLMRSVSRAYDNISSKIKSPAIPQSQKVQTFRSPRSLQQSSGGGCAPCSRKRKQNA